MDYTIEDPPTPTRFVGLAAANYWHDRAEIMREKPGVWFKFPGKANSSGRISAGKTAAFVDVNGWDVRTSGADLFLRRRDTVPDSSAGPDAPADFEEDAPPPATTDHTPLNIWANWSPRKREVDIDLDLVTKKMRKKAQAAYDVRYRESYDRIMRTPRMTHEQARDHGDLYGALAYDNELKRLIAEKTTPTPKDQ